MRRMLPSHADRVGMMHAKANMALREEQKAQLLQSRRQLMDTMAALLQERRMIQALIKASLLVPWSASSLADASPDHLAPASPCPPCLLGCGVAPVRIRLSTGSLSAARALSVKPSAILSRSASRCVKCLKPGDIILLPILDW